MGLSGKVLNDYGPTSQSAFLHVQRQTCRKKSTTWSLCRRGEGRLSPTRSKMDDANDVYEEKRFFGPFHGLTMNYEGSKKYLVS